MTVSELFAIQDHQKRLVKMFRTLLELAETRGYAPVDKLGVRGFTKGQTFISLNDMKSGWFLDATQVCQKHYLLSTRPMWSSRSDISSNEYVERVASIQYSKKTRTVWYQDWKNDCPRFSTKLIADLVYSEEYRDE